MGLPTKTFKTTITDYLNNTQILDSDGLLTNPTGTIFSLANLSYLDGDATCRLGTKQTKVYLLNKIKIASSQSKNNAQFTESLNKLFPSANFKAFDSDCEERDDDIEVEEDYDPPTLQP